MERHSEHWAKILDWSKMPTLELGWMEWIMFREVLDDNVQAMSVHQAHPKNLEEAIHVAMDLEAWPLPEKKRSDPERRGAVRPVTWGHQGMTHWSRLWKDWRRLIQVW